MVFHRKQLEADIASVKTDWAAAEYYQSGKAAADILYVSVGPVPQPANNVSVDLLIAPELAAGFVFGMIGEDHFKEFAACYKSASPLLPYLESTIKNLEAFHILAALKDMHQFVNHFHADFEPCTAVVTEEITELKQWAKRFDHPAKLVVTATKNYLENKEQIKADIWAIKEDWNTKVYFASGDIAAHLFSTLVGPVGPQ